MAQTCAIARLQQLPLKNPVSKARFHLILRDSSDASGLVIVPLVYGIM